MYLFKNFSFTGPVNKKDNMFKFINAATYLCSHNYLLHTLLTNNNKKRDKNGQNMINNHNL